MTRIRFNALNAVNMGVGIILNINIPTAYKNAVQTILDGFKEGNEYDIKQIRQKRSLSANAYFWALADELAKVLKITKEEVYKRAIYHAGRFEVLETKDTPTRTKEEVAKDFCRKWCMNGLGWFAYQDKIKPEVIYVYYGSSVYDSKEMGRLIDCVQDECRLQGIEVRPKEEVEALLKEWEKQHG